MTEKTENTPTFEQQLTRLGEIVRQLERGDAALVAACTRELDEAEQRIVKLRAGADGEPVEEPFEEAGE